MNLKLFLVACCCTYGIAGYGQRAQMSGNVQLPDEWRREAYICQIPDFNRMAQASDRLLVAKTKVDSMGNFQVSFPANFGETLYRIQFIKVNDPVSTIIIGGDDENHAFFIAKNNDKLFFKQDRSERFISQDNIKDGGVNDELAVLLRLAKSDTLPRDSVKEGLIRLAKHAKSDVVALLSVHLMFGLNSSQKEQVVEIISTKDKSNPYGERIFKEYTKDRTWVYLLIFTSACALIGIPVGMQWYRHGLLLKSLRLLSPRELSVVRLLLDGRSNKEIAAALNIELSTVKTHVNNSYAKLKVADRKGLMKYQKLITQLAN